MINKLNNPVFSKNDLDEASYYVKSGYGFTRFLKKEFLSTQNYDFKNKAA